MPTRYDDAILNADHGRYPDGQPTKTVVYSMVYPPVGFFPFADIGNGDYYGFYWPIGREDEAPLVASSSHDAYALIPEHGDLEAAALCQLARDEDRELTPEFEAAFDALGRPRPSIDSAGVIAVDDHRQLLGLDPSSPFRNCAVADQLVSENDLDGAEVLYRRAIELLPEYGAAHFGLGYLLRRTRRQPEASVHLRKSLVCPLAFWGGCFWADHILPGKFRNDWARKALLWLQRTKEPDDSLRDDPFMSAVGQLTLETGVATSQDIDLSIEMVDAYRSRGQVLDAALVWITVADRAALETTSFRERYKLTPRSYAIRLSSLFRGAGIDSRASLVESMLSAMEQPEGLYL